MTNPSVVAAALAAIAGIVGTFIAGRVKRVVAQDNLQQRSLTALAQGWDSYTSRLMKRITDLEDEMHRRDVVCEKRISELEQDLERREKACLERITVLEKKLREIQQR